MSQPQFEYSNNANDVSPFKSSAIADDHQVHSTSQIDSSFQGVSPDKSGGADPPPKAPSLKKNQKYG